MNPPNPSHRPFSPEELFDAYQEARRELGTAPIVQPGRIRILGWDLHYLCGAVLPSFIDSLLIRRLADFIPDNEQPRILDCGANIGFSVLNYKRQFPRARITAFEPDPRFSALLRENLKRNGAGDVRVVEAAVWTRNGRVKWRCDDADGSRIIAAEEENRAAISVPSIDLTDYLMEPVDLLKVDIEGAEYRVISHLEPALQKVKNITIECHLDQFSIAAFGQLLGVLSRSGFNIGINSYGPWRDLVRWPAEIPGHFDQYVQVAGRRETTPIPDAGNPLLPSSGVQMGLEFRSARDQAKNELKAMRQSLAASQAEGAALRYATASAPRLVARIDRKLARLQKPHPDTEEVGRPAVWAVLLSPPYNPEIGKCWMTGLPKLLGSADDEVHPERSSLLVFENEKPLGPPHRPHDEIRNLGAGRYSHWGNSLYFSSSDGSDPNSNGRRYAVAFAGAAIPMSYILAFLEKQNGDIFILDRWKKAAAQKMQLPLHRTKRTVLRAWHKAAGIVGWIRSPRVPNCLSRELLILTCLHLAPLWRRFGRRSRPFSGQNRVCHVTCSFDLGGTQRQIKNMCRGSHDTRFEHVTTEIFPEQNFIYRRGEILHPGDYIKGNLLFRKLGRWVMDPGFRSMQIVQIYKLWRDFQRIKPQIVVGWGHEIAMLTFAAAAFARVPRIVFCIRTWNPSFGWTTIPRLLYRSHKKMLPLLDGIIVNSSPLRKDYAAWMGIAPERVSICPNGIDAEAAANGVPSESCQEIRRALNIPAEALVILNVGRFSKEKGQMLLLRAYEKVVRERLPDPPYLVLCGDGPLLDTAKSYAHARGLFRCRFPGRIKEVDRYLSAVDIYVMPSDFEGMPNAMMEAMAHGLPCISTDRSGALDVARDNLEALYCRVGSVDELEDRLIRLIRSPQERRRLGQNARKRLDEFTIHQMASCFDGILTRIADREF